MKLIAFTLLLFLAIGICVAGKKYSIKNSDLKAAMSLFERLIAHANEFDPEILDLYAPDAKVISNRLYPDGQVRTIELTAQQWKDLLLLALPVAKDRGDRSEFSDVSFIREGKYIRIKATRLSLLKGDSGPYFLLLYPNASGDWKILEERVYTQAH